MSEKPKNEQDELKAAEKSASGKKWEYVEQCDADESDESQAADAEKLDDFLEESESDDVFSSLTKEEAIKQLKLAQEEKAASFDRFARAQAEVKNIQHSARKDVESARKFALKGFVQELLPIVDNLERSIEAVPETADLDESMTVVVEGVQLTQKSLLACLEKFNVEQLNPVGDVFNPEFHEAISMQPKPDVPPNTVLQVLQKGYLLNQRLIRPAMVIVSKS
jgi:molecular chaperone GrpE